jgi:hypothetical protein
MRQHPAWLMQQPATLLAQLPVHSCNNAHVKQHPGYYLRLKHMTRGRYTMRTLYTI